MSIGSKARATDPKERIRQLIAEYAGDVSSLYQHGRIQYVQKLSETYRFFHNELEFIEVFKVQSGFNVIAGNPPWIKLIFEEKGILSETFPEVVIRKTSASSVKKYYSSTLVEKSIKISYYDEYIETESISNFIGSLQNYYYLKGQQSNLYKAIIINGLNQISEDGYLGLLHPESIYDDPNGNLLRNKVFKHLRFHFQFVNTLKLFPEILHWVTYGANIYSGEYLENICFKSIYNLYHPYTIENSFLHKGIGNCGGLKVKDEKSSSYIWNQLPHKERIITINKDVLRLFAKLNKDQGDCSSVKLMSIHSTHILAILDKFSRNRMRINDIDHKTFMGWDENQAQQEGIIKRETRWANINNYELILNGPHFYISQLLYKSPKRICDKPLDYSTIDLQLIDTQFQTRTNFIPSEDIESFTNRFKYLGERWIDKYKLVLSRRLSLSGERTLQVSLAPPRVSHINSVISIVCKNESELVQISAILSSIPLDFYVKSLGRGDLYDFIIRDLLYTSKYQEYLSIRSLLLNCLTNEYSEIWSNQWNDTWENCCWAKDDMRLKDFKTLAKKWSWDTPLRNWYERRWALVEIDIIVSMALGLSLEELLLIYSVHFPVLQQNEDDTWYDQKGNIVFTCSKGLTGVGLDRSEWERITKQVNPMQRTLKEGDTYEHTITKSELYYGKKITYYAPFDKCDRVEDYKIAWKHFEKVFSENK
jgi:hypothetical protein